MYMKKRPAGLFFVLHLLQVLCCFFSLCCALCIQCRVGSCDTSEYDEICNCIAAQTVRAVNAAGHFACCEQTRNRSSLGADHFCVRIDLQAAHGVMDACGHLDGIERFFNSGVQKQPQTSCGWLFCKFNLSYTFRVSQALFAAAAVLPVSN